MRIVSGRFRGRRLEAPRGTATRPTADRVREAVFSALDAAGGGYREGRVLDLFAGSGALSFEALSRGAAHAVLVERDRAALAAIAANAESLGCPDEVTVITGDAFGAGGTRAAADGPYALLLLDPPYRIDGALVTGLVEGLVGAGALARGAAIVWEHDSGREIAQPEGASVVRTYTYGDTAVTVLQATGEGGEHR